MAFFSVYRLPIVGLRKHCSRIFSVKRTTRKNEKLPWRLPVTTDGRPYPAVCKRIRMRSLWRSWTARSPGPSDAGGRPPCAPSCRRWIPADRGDPSADRSTCSSCRRFWAAHRADFSGNRLADNLRTRRKERRSNIMVRTKQKNAERFRRLKKKNVFASTKSSIHDNKYLPSLWDIAIFYRLQF